MEGQSSKENTTDQVSFENGGTNNNHLSYSAHISNSKSVIPPPYGRTADQFTISLPKPFQNYVEYLSESSTTTTNEHLIGSSYLPFGSIRDSNSSRSFFHSDAGKSFPFKPIASSTNADFDIRKRLGFWKPNEEGEEGIKVETEISENRLYAEAKAGSSTLPPKPGSSSSKHKGTKTRDNDRQRRQRISDNLKALHQLLPNPDQEGSQAYILDDIIDYIKYSQLQLKELSGSRLQADSNAIPLVFHEGYGHYIDQQMLNEPLEEIMGKLLEEHSGAANQLLESKGLFLMPIALIDELNEAMQMFSGTA